MKKVLVQYHDENEEVFVEYFKTIQVFKETYNKEIKDVMIKSKAICFKYWRDQDWQGRSVFYSFENLKLIIGCL